MRTINEFWVDCEYKLFNLITCTDGPKNVYITSAAIFFVLPFDKVAPAIDYHHYFLENITLQTLHYTSVYFCGCMRR
jgi:hypothetical protein